jgi:hypothetical protein
MDEDFRKFIALTESLLTPPEVIPQPVVFEPEAPAQPQLDEELVQEMEKLIFKLRSYQDPDIGEYSAGVEAGMNRAADMVQNLLNRLRGM